MSRKIYSSRPSIAAVCLAGISLAATSAQAQNDNVFAVAGHAIYEYSGSPQSVGPWSQTLFYGGLSGDNAGLGFDGNGDLFDVDYGNGNIYEFANNHGTLNSTPSLYYSSGINSAFTMAVDSTGNIYLASAGGTITEITSSLTQKTLASGINNLYGLAVDGTGDLLFTEGNQYIYQVTSTGPQINSEIPGGNSLNINTEGLTYNNTGNVFGWFQISQGTLGTYLGQLVPFAPGGIPATQNYGYASPLNNVLAADDSGAIFAVNGTSINVIVPGTRFYAIETGFTATGLAVQPVPEPSAVVTLAAGAIAVAAYRRRKNT